MARRLVRDAAAAEDVVQDTFVAALEGAPEEMGRLRPWLARVARNFALERRRGEANRAIREARRAREDRAPSASETAERLESQKRLVEALQALQEPYRTTVTMRYLDGLSAARIARKQGIPAGTVRWRLKHGLDELRRRLKTRSGSERSSWCLALLPLLRRPPLVETAAGISSAAVQGVMAMNAVTKVGIAAALALTASVGVWVAVDGPEPRLEPAAPRVQAAADENPLARPGDAAAPTLAASAEGTTRSVAPPAEEDRPAPPAAAPPRTLLEARFVDRANRPVEGVALSLSSFPDLRPAASGSDGRIALELDFPDETHSTELEASRTGFATHFGRVTLVRDRTTYVGDVTLDPGGSVAGRVLAPDGRPAGGAEVFVTTPEIETSTDESRTRGPSRGDLPEGKSSADGSFRIDGVPAGFVRVWACAENSRWGFSEPIEVPVAAVRAGIEVRLVALEKEDTIEGIVLSPKGVPVPGADVRYSGHGRNGTWSGNFDAGLDGRFRHRVPVRGTHELFARDPLGRWPDASVRGVEPGAHDLVLQFPRARFLDLSVRGIGSEPLEEFAAAVLSADRSRTLVPGKVETHAEGRARLLVPGEAFVVEIRARGHGSAELGPWAPEEAPASASCRLERRPGVRGRVTAAGEPVAGARVALHEMAGSDSRIEKNGFATRLHPQPEDTATTDAEGYFELDPSRPGKDEGHRFFQRDPGETREFAILCETESHARAEVSPLEIDPAVGLDGIAVLLDPGGAIEGRVRTAPGKDPAGVVVAVDRCDGHPRTQRVGPDGRYRFERLTPGRWNVSRAGSEVRKGSVSTSWSQGPDVKASYPWNCTVSEGATTRFDLDLTDDRPCVLTARVIVNGLPAAGWTAVLDPETGGTGKERPGGAVDSGGTLRIETPDPGAWTLRLSPPAETQSSARFLTLLALERGDNGLEIAFAVGTVRGHLLAPSSDATISFRARSTGGPLVESEIDARPDAEGKFELPFAMAGHGRLCRMKQLEGGGTYGPVAEVEVDVPAGGWADLAVP